MLIGRVNLPLLCKSDDDGALSRKLPRVEARIAAVTRNQRLHAPSRIDRARSFPNRSHFWKWKDRELAHEFGYLMSDETGLSATISDGVPAAGGLHCETTALAALLRHAGRDL